MPATNPPPFKGSRSNAGGNSSGARNHHRRRKALQPPKYIPNAYDDDDDFQKLPSDTAPAYRFVEKKRKLRGNPRTLEPEQDHHSQEVTEHPRELLQENIFVAKPPQPSSGELPPIDHEDEILESSYVVESSSIDNSFYTEAQIPKLVETYSHLGGGPNDAEKPISILTQNILEPLAVPQPQAVEQASQASEAINRLSIAELLDHSDHEYMERRKPLRPPPGLSIPLTPQRDGPYMISSSSPLTITQTPINPQNAEPESNDLDEFDNFVRLADVEIRFLTDKLNCIDYNPDLRGRVQGDFEVIESAFKKLGIPHFDHLHPCRLVYNSLLSLRKALERHNSDAKVLGSLKRMTETNGRA
ncbi:hypothetical protein ABW19_dt0208815 [Dactylella cylindrospora]|nr:hypothetical protein ABW19_dt0208815 [Dactylella cylindrospora]